MHYVEWVWKCECVFELHRTWGYGRLSRQPHACTHRSWCDFMALWLHLRSVFSVFTPGSSSFFLAPITTTFAIWRRDNETANTATPLRNLRKCIQLFGAFLSMTNCIPKAWHHTPPTENTHCKISSLTLRRLAIIYIVGSKTWEAPPVAYTRASVQVTTTSITELRSWQYGHGHILRVHSGSKLGLVNSSCDLDIQGPRQGISFTLNLSS